MIITIGGMPGSGKSTIATRLSEQLGIPWYSVGTLFGKIATERGMTIGEFNKLSETDPSADRAVDEYQKKLGESGEAFIMDGRMSWFFIPQALKVYLTVDPDVAAERIFNAPKHHRADEPDYASAEEVKRAIAERSASDQRRYRALYGVDYLDQKNYDVVIDTTHLTPEEIVSEILAVRDQRLHGN